MRWIKVGLWLWGLATVGFGVAMRQEWVERQPATLALMVGVLFVGCAVQAIALLVSARRKTEGRGRALTAVLGLAGLLVSLGAGLEHWLTGIEGTLLLNEGESLPLGAQSHFRDLEVGPLASSAALAAAVELVKVELLPGGPEGFSPEAQLRLLVQGQPVAKAVVSLRQVAPLGSLLVLQGAFGFAPRIGITRDGQAVFDERVPFTTAFDGPRGLRFERDFTLEKEALSLHGVVDLDSLDADMKGHATLRLDVSRAGTPLGRGALTPGQFADLEGGYRVGFVGLSRWSEIIVTSPRPRRSMFAGFAVAALGLLAWVGAVIVEKRAPS